MSSFRIRLLRQVLLSVFAIWLLCFPVAQAAWIWVEGENPVLNKMNRHPWWYDQVKKQLFSGGDFISNFDKEKPGEAEYRFTAPTSGQYELWVRANPLMAKLSYSLNAGSETDIDLNREKRDEQNAAADGKPDLRFIAWSKVGEVTLKQGENRIRFRMSSQNNHHGYLDCFVFSSDPFLPRGLVKPDQMADELKRFAADNKSWFPFEPRPDNYAASPIDLRFLNERFAGEHGFVTVKDGEFAFSATGEPVRFWAVNGPPHNLSGAELRACARLLAKHGVNLVRVHGGYFNERGEVNIERVRHALEIVDAMKAEGIYTHFSIYFPLWITPKADNPFLKGYDGTKHPFAALFFNPDFQAQYRKWWTVLLTTPNAAGKTLAEEPAVAGLEMQNEDSFFFWTFSEQNIPDPELRMLEKLFGDWLAKKYGSVAAALAKWGDTKVKRDSPDEGRAGFRPLWAVFNEKKLRDQDTAQFLVELQTSFYRGTQAFLRKLGFKGPITASNWATASPEVFGPLEKLSYAASGDFIDRHGYFSCNHKGENAEWSVRNGHTYADRSGLRFDAEVPGKPRQFVHPAMDVHYDGKPSMISETTWNRPNRFRSEAPLYFSVFGALQHSDAIVHFALDSGRWAVKPGFWMQPWTLMSPAMMGQFPAAALIYRRSLVASGDVLAEIRLSKADLLALKGTPLPQDAALDELRLKDIPSGTEVKPGARLDPLLHYAGRAGVTFADGPGSVRVKDLKSLINHDPKTVTSSTGELKLDYGKGVLTINAPRAQGVSGLLRGNCPVETRDLSIASDMELGHIVVASLDDQPLASSGKMLLQVMSEEKSAGFETEPAGDGLKRIVNIGTDPWMVKEFSGTVKFKPSGAGKLKVTPLDFNGYPAGTPSPAGEIRLQPTVVYYLIE